MQNRYVISYFLAVTVVYITWSLSNGLGLNILFSIRNLKKSQVWTYSNLRHTKFTFCTLNLVCIELGKSQINRHKSLSFLSYISFLRTRLSPLTFYDPNAKCLVSSLNQLWPLLSYMFTYSGSSCVRNSYTNKAIQTLIFYLYFHHSDR